MYEGALTDLRHASVTLIAGAATFSPEGAETLPSLDKELNVLYGRWLRSLEEPEEKELARAAERAWMRYRDAVSSLFQAVLAGRRPPRVIASAVLARLTRERVEALRSLHLSE